MSSYADIQQQLRNTPKKWLVTGAAGFIGSNLVQKLLEIDQTVTGLDNLSSGYKKNIEQVLDSVTAEQAARFTFIEGDITDLSTCQTACAEMDYILHHAAQVSVPASVDNPLYNNQVNVDGFLNILTSARDNQVKRIVYASSSAVYGNDPQLPKTEDMQCLPISPYGVTKHINEQYARLYEETYGLRSVGLRYFNVFGPRQDPNGAYAAVIPKWISAFLAGQQPIIYGEGDQTRDFCYVDNVVQANILAACTTKGERSGQVFNVACEKAMDLNELFNLIKDQLSSQKTEVTQISPNYLSPRAGDIKHSWASISAIVENLGYQPSHTVEEGLRASLDWYINNL
jgi:UDP-N-acetylglucosamine 4-epimerase